MSKELKIDDQVTVGLPNLHRQYGFWELQPYNCYRIVGFTHRGNIKAASRFGFRRVYSLSTGICLNHQLSPKHCLQTYFQRARILSVNGERYARENI